MTWQYTPARSLETLGASPSPQDADAFVAGITTHDVLAALATATPAATVAVVAALVRRDERKAERKARKAA